MRLILKKSVAKKLFTAFALSAIAFFSAAAQPKLIYFDNTSQDEIPGLSYVHMHNKKGVRLELNLNKQKLVLWTSPLAGKSIVHTDRNFSNRDDNTSIFDKIGFPELKFKDFVRCDYDAFYSKVYFKNNTLHLLMPANKSAVVLWFDKPEKVEIKTDKQDKLLKYTSASLETSHPDRGKTFSFVAQTAPNKGAFVHQKVYDPSRSFYSRIALEAGQTLVLAGDDASENIAALAQELSLQSSENLIKENEKLITKDVSYGNIKVRNNAELQKIIDLNKRILYSMQDESGAMRAALRYIYYLIWHRDGGMVHSYNAYTGWVDPLKKWCEFILANPTVNEKGERFFGQLVSPITKLEEDGPFYGIWSVFTYWSQSGDDAFLTPQNLKVLEDNIKWLENNYYDPKKGMFFRYHYCESPYYKSSGNGWDDAVGRQTNPEAYRWKGDTILRAYDTYINSINYANYVMMSMMEKGEKAAEYAQKAEKLSEKLNPYFTDNGTFPSYGELVTTQDKYVQAEGPGADEADYLWGFGLPLFYPHYTHINKIKDRLITKLLHDPKDQFLSGIFSNVASLDPEIHGTEKIVKMIQYVIPQITTSGECLPMPYTIPEIVDVKDCNIYHDVRPQPFSISAYFGAIGNLGVHKLPLGLATRGTDFLDAIENYQYKNSLIDFKFSGTGSYVKSIEINGKTVKNSLQIPESMLVNGKNVVKVISQSTKPAQTYLVSSSLKLNKIEGNKLLCTSLGHNVLTFKNLKKEIIIKDKNGAKMPISLSTDGNISYVTFSGKGEVTIEF